MNSTHTVRKYSPIAPAHQPVGQPMQKGRTALAPGAPSKTTKMLHQYFNEIREQGNIISPGGDKNYQAWVRAAVMTGPAPSQARAALDYVSDHPTDHTLKGFLQYVQHSAGAPTKVLRLLYEAAVDAKSAFYNVVELKRYPSNALEAAVAVRINPGMTYPEFPTTGTGKKTDAMRVIDRLFEKRRYREYGDDRDMRVKKKILAFLIEHGGDPNYPLPAKLERTLNPRRWSHPRRVADHMRTHGIPVTTMNRCADTLPILARSYSASSSGSSSGSGSGSGSDMGHSPRPHSRNSSSSPQPVRGAAVERVNVRPVGIPPATHEPAPWARQNAVLDSTGAQFRPANVPAAKRLFFDQTPDIPAITRALDLRYQRTLPVLHPSAQLPLPQSHSAFPPPAPGLAYHDAPFPELFDPPSVLGYLNDITAKFPSN